MRRSREIKRLRASSAIARLLAALLPLAVIAASPAPPTKAPAHRPRIDVTKIQPKALLPKHSEHTEYMVDVNKLGQVTRVRSQRASDSATFNAQTYGNALQTFIRTPDGHVVLGVYRLTYDYDPKTERVRRDVSLVHQGGVNPDAKGAAASLMQAAQRQPTPAPHPLASVDPRNLPELKSVIEPTPEPSPHS